VEWSDRVVDGWAEGRFETIRYYAKAKA